MKSKLAHRDAAAVTVMRELAARYPRNGYRRIQVFLARRGQAMGTPILFNYYGESDEEAGLDDDARFRRIT